MNYPCINHPDRIAIVDKQGKLLCWECYLDKGVFESRFGKDFYATTRKYADKQRG